MILPMVFNVVVSYGAVGVIILWNKNFSDCFLVTIRVSIVVSDSLTV